MIAFFKLPQMFVPILPTQSSHKSCQGAYGMLSRQPQIVVVLFAAFDTIVIH